MDIILRIKKIIVNNMTEKKKNKNKYFFRIYSINDNYCICKL